MKVLHINTNFEQSSIYKNMIKSFDSYADIDGIVYYPSFKAYKVNEKYKHLIDNSVCLKKIDRFFFFYRNLKLIKDITNRQNIGEYSHILAYSLFSNGYLAYSLYKKFNIPYIVIVQNTDINFYFKRVPFLRFIGRKIIKFASKVIFISKPYRDLLVNTYLLDSKLEVLKKSEIIPFGIDDYWFENKGSPRKISKGILSLLYVGKINRNKNIETIIKVCEQLINKRIDSKLTIIGDFVDEKYKKIVENYKFVNYQSFVNKEDLLKIYRDHDIFIMPSITETFGLVYGEAMTQGLPVIYTEDQGFDQQFKSGEIGFSVNPMNVEQIVNKVGLILDQYEEMSSNCLKLIDDLKWKKITIKYKKLLNIV